MMSPYVWKGKDRLHKGTEDLNGFRYRLPQFSSLIFFKGRKFRNDVNGNRNDAGYGRNEVNGMAMTL